MPNLLKEIRTCQYTSSVADANGNIQTVHDASSGTRNEVSVLPVEENGRRVHSAVSLTAGEAIGQADAASTRLTSMNEGIGTVEVTPSATPPNGSIVYGALETVNPSTQRCGVLTKGTVLFRNAGLGPATTSGIRSLPDTAIGSGIVGSAPTTTATLLTGTVQAATNTYGDTIGTHIILSKIGNYVLVQLGGNALKRPLGLLYT